MPVSDLVLRAMVAAETKMRPMRRAFKGTGPHSDVKNPAMDSTAVKGTGLRNGIDFVWVGGLGNSLWRSMEYNLLLR